MLKPKSVFFACREAPAAMCHASSLLVLGRDRLLCVFFGGPHEGSPATAIYAVTVKDGVPGEPRRVAYDGREAHWNPVLFFFKDGHIGLIYHAGNVIAAWRSFIAESFDGGETFTPARELVPGDRGGRGPSRNQPLRLKSGRLLFPGSCENGPWHCFADYTDNELATLHKSTEIRVDARAFGLSDGPRDSAPAVSAQSLSGQGVIQPAFFEDDAGVHALMRSSLGAVMRADSKDEGETWSAPYPVALPNNNSGLDCAVCGGTLFVVCNPVAGNWGRRTPLTVFSYDGEKFKEEFVLEHEEGEFSYPCAVCAAEEESTLYVSYTHRRKNIRIAGLKYY